MTAMTSDSSKTGKGQEHIWMVALYELEERTSELLERLGALGIDTGEATIVRVELDDEATIRELKAAPTSSRQRQVSVPTTARYAITGAVIGSVILFLLGVPFYEASILDLGRGSGLFVHSVFSTLLGCLAGSAFGWLTSTVVKRARINEAVPEWARVNRDGFLVAIKMPPGLAQQAEEIARRLGAKEILL